MVVDRSVPVDIWDCTRCEMNSDQCLMDVSPKRGRTPPDGGGMDPILGPCCGWHVVKWENDGCEVFFKDAFFLSMCDFAVDDV